MRTVHYAVPTFSCGRSHVLRAELHIGDLFSLNDRCPVERRLTVGRAIAIGSVKSADSQVLFRHKRFRLPLAFRSDRHVLAMLFTQSGRAGRRSSLKVD